MIVQGGLRVVPASVLRAYGAVATPPSPGRLLPSEPLQEKTDRLEQPFKAATAIARLLTSSNLPIEDLQLRMAVIQSQFTKEVYGDISPRPRR